jgi:hypothetical protein
VLPFRSGWPRQARPELAGSSRLSAESCPCSLEKDTMFFMVIGFAMVSGDC